MLVESLTPWRIETLSDGIALIPREGVLEGAIRIRERQRPLRSARAIFASALGRFPMTTVTADRIEELVTSEGEYGAFQRFRGESRGEPFVRCFGAVFGDDFYTFVDAGTTVPVRFAALERTARIYTSYVALGLGHRRTRRFAYRPPRDWQPLARGLDTWWMPPAFPATSAALVMYAARPAGRSRPDVLLDLLADLRLRGARIGEPAAGAPVFSEAGLSGSRWKIDDAEVAIFEDERFVYPVVASGEAARAELERVLHSVQPIPLPEPVASQDSVLHWAT